MTPKQKLLFLSKKGIIRYIPERELYLYRAYPDIDTPVIQMQNKSKWDLIEIVFNLINELN